jgi:type VI secretion system secreted protein VgrG
LHLTAYAHQQGSQTPAQSMECRQGLEQLEHAQDLIRTLAETAQKHDAKLSGESAADRLPSFRAYGRSLDSLSVMDGRDGLLGAEEGAL